MIYFALAVLGLIIVLLIPTSDSLPVVGQRSLAILTFAVILWVTQAVSYEVSAVMIIVLVSFLVGLSPTFEDPSVFYVTIDVLGMAVNGFSFSDVTLVDGVFFFLHVIILCFMNYII